MPSLDLIAGWLLWGALLGYFAAGILLIAPGRASIGIWSPGLNGNGNSQMGSYAAERLAHAMDWSVFRAS